MLRGGKGRVICWDLDETTGSFRDYGRMRLTRGIKPLLEGLGGLGIRHVITTAASREHAETALGNFGVMGLYERIFDASEICDSVYNKYYAPVASFLGMGHQDAADRILVVGNLPRDAPADLDLTFLYHPEGSEFDAAVYMKIIGRLMHLSDSWAEAHALMAGQNTHSIAVSGFDGGQQFVEGIWVGVGRHLRNVRPEKPSDRVISVYSVPDGYRPAESEKTKINDGAESVIPPGPCRSQ
ncbi:hypothetical protein L0Y65_00265 [Candidatus Micrarchaeota archaeon]|nr:hypothetical protein [Candidatus Micrarchaeota archaeon]